MTWHETYILMAKVMAKRSKDRSTQVGAVIVGPDKEVRSTGYNGMPRGVDDTKDYRHQRPEKYNWFAHAEANAIYNAARCGIHTLDCIIYVTLFPCPGCAQAIVNSGIKEVIVESLEVPERMLAAALVSQDIFLEGHVNVKEVGYVDPEILLCTMEK